MTGSRRRYCYYIGLLAPGLKESNGGTRRGQQPGDAAALCPAQDTAANEHKTKISTFFAENG